MDLFEQLPIWDQEKLEIVCCDFCGANSTSPVITRADGLNVVECLRCGLAYINPRPKFEYISRLYGQYYFYQGNI